MILAGPVGAATASATLTAGGLGFASTPGDVTFPSTTPNGQNKTVAATQPLPVTAAQITATSATAGSGNCSIPVSQISYPVTVPAAATTPTPVKPRRAPAPDGSTSR